MCCGVFVPGTFYSMVRSGTSRSSNNYLEAEMIDQVYLSHHRLP